MPDRTVRIELRVPDTRTLLDLLRALPDDWSDVIEELEGALERAQR